MKEIKTMTKKNKLNLIVDIALYLILFPYMLNSVINYIAGVNVPIILISLVTAIAIYKPELVRSIGETVTTIIRRVWETIVEVITNIWEAITKINLRKEER